MLENSRGIKGFFVFFLRANVNDTPVRYAGESLRYCLARIVFESSESRKLFFFWDTGLFKLVSMAGKTEGGRAFRMAARKGNERAAGIAEVRTLAIHYINAVAL